MRSRRRRVVLVVSPHLVAAWHILRHGVSYRDLGRDHFDRLDRDRLIRYHTRRLADLGVLLPVSPAVA